MNVVMQGLAVLGSEGWCLVGVLLDMNLRIGLKVRVCDCRSRGCRFKYLLYVALDRNACWINMLHDMLSYKGRWRRGTEVRKTK